MCSLADRDLPIPATGELTGGAGRRRFVVGARASASPRRRSAGAFHASAIATTTPVTSFICFLVHVRGGRYRSSWWARWQPQLVSRPRAGRCRAQSSATGVPAVAGAAAGDCRKRCSRQLARGRRRGSFRAPVGCCAAERCAMAPTGRPAHSIVWTGGRPDDRDRVGVVWLERARIAVGCATASLR